MSKGNDGALGGLPLLGGLEGVMGGMSKLLEGLQRGDAGGFGRLQHQRGKVPLFARVLGSGPAGGNEAWAEAITAFEQGGSRMASKGNAAAASPPSWPPSQGLKQEQRQHRAGPLRSLARALPVRVPLRVPAPAARLIAGGMHVGARRAKRLWSQGARLLKRKMSGAEGGRRGLGVKVQVVETEHEALVSRGLAHERRLEVSEALECFKQAAALEPEDAHTLWRYGKQVSDLTMLPGLPREVAKSHLQEAMEVTARAIEKEPHNPHARLAMAVHMGRWSWYADNKTKVKMAGSSLEEITKAIELDPGEDMAYYCVGRWHNEMAGVNALVRALVPVLYGAALPSASYETARAALERAVELRPDRLVHRLELGRTHHLMGAHREAEAVLEAAMELEVDEINSHLCKLEMQQTLKKLQKRGRGRKPTA